MGNMKPTLRHRVQYAFDNLMARGTTALIAMLGVLSLAIVICAATVVSALGFTQEGGNQLSFAEAAWKSLLRTLDPGTMGGDTGGAFRLIMLLVTLGGIFVVSTLIGIIDNDLETRTSQLRKGRSLVLEAGHTLILGWSSLIFTILNELMVANENQPKGRIVILAERDKMEMEDHVRDRVEPRGRTRIICRNGNPLDPGDLSIASPGNARSIIVLPPKGANADIDIIKTVLAITTHPDRRPGPYTIVTQVQDNKNLEVLKMIGSRDRLATIHTCDFIARIIAQTARQSGLSIVLTELMDFKGDEIYFKAEPELIGKTYRQTLLAFEDSCVMGLRKANGKISLNPPMDSLLETGDQIFALSADDDTIRLTKHHPIPIDESAIEAGKRPGNQTPERCLILGWNDRCAAILRELDAYVASGTEVTLVAEMPNVEIELRTQLPATKHEKLSVIEGDTTDRALLDTLAVETYDHIIVLPYSGLDPQEADAKTLVTLLHLRDMANQKKTSFSIVSEMLDLRNRELANSANVDDFIVSDELVSLMLVQFSENVELYDVFADIFDPEGSEIYLKPMSDYVGTGRPVNFYTVLQAASLRGQTAIGYRLGAEKDNSAKSFGVHTNPKKSEPVTFTQQDKIIVLAEQ